MNKNNRPTGKVALTNMPARQTRITTVSNWRYFVHAPVPEQPLLPGLEEWAGWSAAERTRYNRTRHVYHANFAPIATPDLQDFHNQMLLQIWKNVDGDDGACPGGLLDGLGTLGKTTILNHLGRRFELEFNDTFPAEDPAQQHQVIPVAIVTMTAGATPKDLSLSLARFYGVPLPTNTKGVTRSDITAAVIEAAEFHQTQLIMVDEAHFINVKTDAGQLANNHFKTLMNETGATFVFAGIDCKGTGLLSEGLPDSSKSQIGGRLMYKAIAPMTRDSAAWSGVLRDLETRLVLGNLPEGTFTSELSAYLYMRTGGSIGSLMNLIRKAARVAVETGTETIDEALLKGITIDHNAELRRTDQGKTAPAIRSKASETKAAVKARTTRTSKTLQTAAQAKA